ncbi:unnamed protein product [Peniophora sp. CBMAI 1063]|nr:unnamed protein product [Peniophora sp. CBMAI 1063]
MQLNTHSAFTPLFADMNIVPLRYRRVMLALRYLRYLLGLEEHRLARIALLECMAMFDAGVPGWLGDLHLALLALLSPIMIPSTAQLREEGAVDVLLEKVDEAMLIKIANDVRDSSRLYLLRDRLTPQRQGPPRTLIFQFRDYLAVRNPENRKALARVIASDHPLALEQLRHGHAKRNGVAKFAVPQEERLCRFCAAAVESPEHAMLSCLGNDALKQAHTRFYGQVHLIWPAFVPPANEGEALGSLKSLLGEKSVLSVTGAA